MTDEKPVATPSYLNTTVRSLDEARAAREPHDAGIPSDSPYEGHGWTPWTDTRPIYQPIHPNDTGRTICDLPDEFAEPDPTFDQEQRAAKRKLFFGVAIRLLALVAAGYILASAWAQFYPLHVRLAVSQEHGFEGGK